MASVPLASNSAPAAPVCRRAGGPLRRRRSALPKTVGSCRAGLRPAEHC